MKKVMFIPFIAFFLLAFFLIRGLYLDPRALPSQYIGKIIPDFDLPLLQDTTQHFTSDNIKGQITLLNIWASWCTSCAKEQLFLMDLMQQGIVIYGINYKDTSLKAKQWLEKWGNPYRTVAADTHGLLGIDLGVYGTPETFLIDSQGYIQYRYAGILTEQVWQDAFLPRIKTLQR